MHIAQARNEPSSRRDGTTLASLAYVLQQCCSGQMMGFVSQDMPKISPLPGNPRPAPVRGGRSDTQQLRAGSSAQSVKSPLLKRVGPIWDIQLKGMGQYAKLKRLHLRQSGTGGVHTRTGPKPPRPNEDIKQLECCSPSDIVASPEYTTEGAQP